MTEVALGDLVGAIRAVNSEQEKLAKDLADLQSQLESEVRQVEQGLDDRVKRLKETVLCCPPAVVQIYTPRDSNLKLNLERDSERPWISSCFYTHPGGYKLSVALKSTDMSNKPWIDNGDRVPQFYPVHLMHLHALSGIPLSAPRVAIERTRKPNLFLSIMAVSQGDVDDHRTWPCEGEVIVMLLDQRKCDPFSIKVSIEKVDVIQPDALLDVNKIKGWVPLPEEAIPFRETSVAADVPYVATGIPPMELCIRIETVILSAESRVWNCS